jgi:hypothetical protein
MLNAHMQTDILRSVHQGVEERRKQPGRKSPLEMLIESIEETLTTFEGRNLFGSVLPNPFQTDPRYPFEAEPAYRYDIKLDKLALRPEKVYSTT